MWHNNTSEYRVWTMSAEEVKGADLIMIFGYYNNVGAPGEACVGTVCSPHDAPRWTLTQWSGGPAYNGFVSS